MSFLKPLFMPKSNLSFPDEWLDHDVSQLDYVVIDCEMTGLNPRKDKLLAVAAVKISKNRILSDQAFYEIIQQPAAKLKNETIIIHRLNHQTISSGKEEKDIIDQLYEFCEGCIPVGHFFNIDLSFLPISKNFSYPYLDTYLLASAFLKLQEPMLDLHNELQLHKLAQRFQIPQFKLHHALSDVCTTACLFLKLTSLLKAHNIITLNSLRRLS